MLYDHLTDSRRGRPAATATQRRTDATEVRMNPWLLWRPERPHAPAVLTVAEMAECACPDLCNRDHVNE